VPGQTTGQLRDFLVALNGFVEFGLAGLGVGQSDLGAVGEDRCGPGEELLLPGVDLRWVDVEVASQSVDRPVTKAIRAAVRAALSSKREPSPRALVPRASRSLGLDDLRVDV